MKQHLQHGNSVMAKLKDNMLQGTLQAVGEGRERVEGEKRGSPGNTRGHMLNLLMASFM